MAVVMQRTCVSCGRKASKQELYRFVWRDGMPLQDRRQSEPGRGAYCCGEERCYRAFFKEMKKWKRVFRL